MMRAKNHNSRIFLRALALLTLVAFVCTDTLFFHSRSLAATTSTTPLEGPNTRDLFASAQVWKTRVPSEWGTVSEIYQAPRGRKPETRTDPGGSRFVVFIQDAHDSMEAQENIAKIIGHLVAEAGVRTVLEEGYEGPVPTDQYFGFMKDPEIRRKVSYFLMDRLRLRAAEYAHINRVREFKLIGADSLKLHKENVDEYRRFAGQKASISGDLAVLDEELQGLVVKRFPKEFYQWLKVKEQFDSKKLDLFTYVARTLPFVQSMESQDATAPLLRFILEAVRSNDPGVIEKAKQIDAREIFGELVKLEESVAGTYLKEATDQKLFEYYKILKLLKRLNELEVTPEEYEAVKTHLAAFNTRSFGQFIHQNVSEPLVLSKQWEKNIRDAVHFYEIAKARDRAVDAQLERFRQSPDEAAAVLVFGGFHKENIKRILEEKGISYVVVSPRMTRESPRHQEYYKCLMSGGLHSFEVPLALRTATVTLGTFEVPFGRAAVEVLGKAAERHPKVDPQLLDRYMTEEISGGEDSKPEDRSQGQRSEMRTPPGFFGKPSYTFSMNQLLEKERLLRVTFPGNPGSPLFPVTVTLSAVNGSFFVVLNLPTKRAAALNAAIIPVMGPHQSMALGFLKGNRISYLVSFIMHDQYPGNLEIAHVIKNNGKGGIEFYQSSNAVGPLRIEQVPMPRSEARRGPSKDDVKEAELQWPLQRLEANIKALKEDIARFRQGSLIAKEISLKGLLVDFYRVRAQWDEFKKELLSLHAGRRKKIGEQVSENLDAVRWQLVSLIESKGTQAAFTFGLGMTVMIILLFGKSLSRSQMLEAFFSGTVILSFLGRTLQNLADRSLILNLQNSDFKLPDGGLAAKRSEIREDTSRPAEPQGEERVSKSPSRFDPSSPSRSEARIRPASQAKARAGHLSRREFLSRSATLFAGFMTGPFAARLVLAHIRLAMNVAGRLQFTVSGPGLYQVESRPALDEGDWSVREAIQIDTPGSYEWRDPDAVSQEKRQFYRMKQIHPLTAQQAAFRDDQIRALGSFFQPGAGLHATFPYPIDVQRGSFRADWTQPTLIGFRAEELAHSVAGDVPGRETLSSAETSLTEMHRFLDRLLRDQIHLGWRGLLPWLRLTADGVERERNEIAFIDNANLTRSLMTASGALFRSQKIHPELAENVAAARQKIKDFLDKQKPGFQAFYDPNKRLFHGSGITQGLKIVWKDGYFVDRLFSECATAVAAVVTYFGIARETFTGLTPRFVQYTINGVTRWVPVSWDGAGFQMTWNASYVKDAPTLKAVWLNWAIAAMHECSLNGIPGIPTAGFNPDSGLYSGQIGLPFHETPDPIISTIGLLNPVDSLCEFLFTADPLVWRKRILEQLPALASLYGNVDSATYTGKVSVETYMGVDHYASFLGLTGKQGESFQAFMEDPENSGGSLYTRYVELLEQAPVKAYAAPFNQPIPAPPVIRTNPFGEVGTTPVSTDPLYSYVYFDRIKRLSNGDGSMTSLVNKGILTLVAFRSPAGWIGEGSPVVKLPRLYANYVRLKVRAPDATGKVRFQVELPGFFSRRKTFEFKAGELKDWKVLYMPLDTEATEMTYIAFSNLTGTTDIQFADFELKKEIEPAPSQAASLAVTGENKIYYSGAARTQVMTQPSPEEPLGSSIVPAGSRSEMRLMPVAPNAPITQDDPRSHLGLKDSREARSEIRKEKESTVLQATIRKWDRYRTIARARAQQMHRYNRELSQLFDGKNRLRLAVTEESEEQAAMILEKVREYAARFQAFADRIRPEAREAFVGEKIFYEEIDKLADQENLEAVAQTLKWRFRDIQVKIDETRQQLLREPAGSDKTAQMELPIRMAALYRLHIKVQLLQTRVYVLQKKLNQNVVLTMVAALFLNYLKLSREYGWQWKRAVEEAATRKVQLIGREGRLRRVYDYASFRITQETLSRGGESAAPVSIEQDRWKKNVQPDGSFVYVPEKTLIGLEDLDKAYRSQIHTIVSQEEDYAQILSHVGDLDGWARDLSTYGALWSDYELRNLRSDLARILEGEPGGLNYGKVSQKAIAADNIHSALSKLEASDLKNAADYLQTAARVLRSRLSDIERTKKGVEARADSLAHNVRMDETRRAAEELAALIAGDHFAEGHQLLDLLYKTHYLYIVPEAPGTSKYLSLQAHIARLKGNFRRLSCRVQPVERERERLIAKIQEDLRHVQVMTASPARSEIRNTLTLSEDRKAEGVRSEMRSDPTHPNISLPAVQVARRDESRAGDVPATAPGKMFYLKEPVVFSMEAGDLAKLENWPELLATASFNPRKLSVVVLGKGNAKAEARAAELSHYVPVLGDEQLSRLPKKAPVFHFGDMAKNAGAVREQISRKLGRDLRALLGIAPGSFLLPGLLLDEQVADSVLSRRGGFLFDDGRFTGRFLEVLFQSFEIISSAA